MAKSVANPNFYGELIYSSGLKKSITVNDLLPNHKYICISTTWSSHSVSQASDNATIASASGCTYTQLRGYNAGMSSPWDYTKVYLIETNTSSITLTINDECVWTLIG